MENKVIHLTLNELSNLLRKQRETVGQHMTRNLSVYTWFNDNTGNIDTDKAKRELSRAAEMAPAPDDFKILEMYLKE